VRKKQIVVIGSNDETEFPDEAFEIGRYIARNNGVIKE